MEKESLVWNKILAAVLKMPGVRVNRVQFLRKSLKGFCSEQRLDMLENVRPYTIVTDKVIDMLAAQSINYHTALATAGSTIAGLPGGLAMAATIPGDITQYYYHVVVLSQKLAYLYGFPDFFEERADGDEEEMSEVASDLLTIFMGSMMGVKVADQGISELAIGVAKSAAGRLPRLVITRAAIYPIAAQVAKLVGAKLTKEGFAKTFGKFIPVAGGIFSGTLTLFTFKPGARRLQKRLKAQKMHFNDGEIDALEFANIRASFVKAEQTQNHPQARQIAMVQAMINMGNISEYLSADVQDVIEDQIARTEIPERQQIELLENLGTEYSFDVDYDVLACDPDAARDTLRGMITVMNAAGRKTMAEKMYLSMAAKTLGISKEELDSLLAAE
jgi:hypothetical protein